MDLPDIRERTRVLDEVAASVLPGEFPAVLALLRNDVALGAVGRRTAHRLLARWAAVEPAGAFRWVMSSAPGPDQASFAESVLRTWAEQDAAGALAEALTYPHDSRRVPLIQAVLGEWGRTRPDDADHWIATDAHETIRGELRAGFLQELARHSPDIACALFLRHREPGLLAPAFRDSLAHWSDVDPIGAVLWLTDLPAGEGKDRVAEALAETWARVDTAAAVNHALKLADPTQREALLAAAVRIQVERSPVAALEWARTSLRGDERASVIASAVAAWAQRAPQDAGAYITGRPVEAGLSRELIRAVAGPWSERDAAAAAAWAANLPGHEIPHDVVDIVVGRWMATSPDAVERWWRQLPGGLMKDAAIQSMLRHAGNIAPARALEALTHMSDAPTRSAQIAHWRERTVARP